MYVYHILNKGKLENRCKRTIFKKLPCTIYIVLGVYNPESNRLANSLKQHNLSDIPTMSSRNKTHILKLKRSVTFAKKKKINSYDFHFLRFLSQKHMLYFLLKSFHAISTKLYYTFLSLFFSSFLFLFLYSIEGKIVSSTITRVFQFSIHPRYD